MLSTKASAQPDSLAVPDTKSYFEDHPTSLLFALLVPRALTDGYRLRGYIASDEYARSIEGLTDREQMDELWLDALVLAHGNYSRALLTTAYSVFEHAQLRLQMPGFVVSIPLTSEDSARFSKRISHLPHHLYLESENDVDKLQHFFSSAWLKYVFGMNWIAGLAGDLVEIGEAAIVVGGANDPRDKHANSDGRDFARFLQSGAIDTDEVPMCPSEALTPNPLH